MSGRVLLIVAGLLGAAGVGFGAYHPHGLDKALAKRGVTGSEATKLLDNFSVAVKYQMYHALAFAAVAGSADKLPRRWLAAVCGLWLAGVVGFCGPLLLQALIGQKLHWAIVPLGGMLMILGWTALIGAAWRSRACPAC